MELTESQVHRQMLRIREGIFDNYVIVDDESEAYTGELKPEIQEIIHGSIITDKVLTEEDFQKLFATHASCEPLFNINALPFNGRRFE